MKNAREILLQILAILGLREGKDMAVDEFLTWVEVQAMTELVEALPQDEQNQVIDQWLSIPDMSGKAEKMFGPSYTVAHMKEALKQATKKAIAKQIVEPHHRRLSPSQRERILALLEQLTG